MRDKIIERDKNLCQLCFSLATEVHHIVPRSHFGKKTKELRDDEKNLVCLCQKCHEDAHRHHRVGELLRLMAKRYNYDYNNWPWMRWLND